MNQRHAADLSASSPRSSDLTSIDASVLIERQSAVSVAIAVGEADPDSYLVHSIERHRARRAPFNYLLKPKRLQVGGLSDRIKGALSSFILAVVTDRAFFIDWREPFALSEVFTPNQIDWRLPSTLESRRTWTPLDLIDAQASFNDQRREEILSALLTRDNRRRQPFKLFSNSLMLEIFQKPRHREKLEAFGFDVSTYARLYQCAFATLFKFIPTREDQARLSEFDAFRVGKHHVVGLQFRSGGDGKWREGNVVSGEDPSQTHQRWPQACAALDRFCEERRLNAVGVHLATDSVRARDSIIARIGDRYPIHYLDMEPMHSERSDADKVRTGIRGVVLDNEMLMRCDDILVGAGAFGRMAAWRTGREPAMAF